MPATDFWEFFNTDAAPHLGNRAETFRKTFSYLDGLQRPVVIVETGCVRENSSWGGDGQSTILFDRYAAAVPGSIVYTVDIDRRATETCRSQVSENVRVHTGDSVKYLASLAALPSPDRPEVDLLYLDSLDVDHYAPEPSAIHHLKELLAISPLLSAETLVVVDDSPSTLLGYLERGEFKPYIKTLRIGGKGQFIAQYAAAVGVKPYFTGYQCAWLGLGRAARST